MIIITNSKIVQKAATLFPNIRTISENTSDNELDEAIKENLSDLRENCKDKGSFDAYVKRHLKILAGIDCKSLKQKIEKAENDGYINVLQSTLTRQRLNDTGLRLSLEKLHRAILNFAIGLEVGVLRVISNALSIAYTGCDIQIEHDEFIFLNNENHVLKYFACCLKYNKLSRLSVISLLLHINLAKYDYNTYHAVFTLNDKTFIDFLKSIEKK